MFVVWLFMGLSCRAKFWTDVDTLSNETPGVMSCSSAVDGSKLLLSLRCILSYLAEHWEIWYIQQLVQAWEYDLGALLVVPKILELDWENTKFHQLSCFQNPYIDITSFVFFGFFVFDVESFCTEFVTVLILGSWILNVSQDDSVLGFGHWSLEPFEGTNTWCPPRTFWIISKFQNFLHQDYFWNISMFCNSFSTYKNWI